MLTHDELIAKVNASDHDLVSSREASLTDTPKQYDYLEQSAAYGDAPWMSGASPKRVGAVRLFHPGLGNPEVSSRLDIVGGLLETRFLFGSSEINVRLFIQRTDNKLWMDITTRGHAPWVTIVMEKEPDAIDRAMPYPEIGAKRDGFEGYLRQRIPAGTGVAPFDWTMAANFVRPTEEIDARRPEMHAYRFRQYCSVPKGARAVFCVAVATSRDGAGDTQARAMKKAHFASPRDFDRALCAHTAAWHAFWNTSSVALEDRELESAWYRNHYSYACSLKEGVIAPGSSANIVPRDASPWHGDYHMNHSFQKWFVTALPTNHPEWIHVYADFIRDKMPIFEYQARLIFGLPGAYCDVSYFPYMSKENCPINNDMGRALSLTGWLGQPLWWYYEYTLDRQWLREYGYEYLKNAAVFYYHYMEKYMQDSGDICPSFRIQEPGWQKDFAGNRNVISDLVMFKKAFEWAIAASGVLDTDAAWREKWCAALAKVPPIDYGYEPSGEGWLGLDKTWKDRREGTRADAARRNRWGGGGWIVFPGEYIDGDGDDELTRVVRDMLSRTDLHDPFTSQLTGENDYPGVSIVHPLSSLLPTIRLAIEAQFPHVRDIILAHRTPNGKFAPYMFTGGDIPKELYSYSGYLWYVFLSVENQYLGVLAVTEMLLQSQGGLIRLFPYWPDGRQASFRHLRARGAFVIDAARDAEGFITAQITSEKGSLCRVKWNGAPPAVTCDGQAVRVTSEGGSVLQFDTQRGGVYALSGRCGQ